MQRWDIRHTEIAERVGPKVLFSTPEARAVLLDLSAGETLSDHSVRERALLQVVSGSVELTTVSGDTREATVCDERALVLFEPGEVHALRARERARLLLVLAPWPGQGHYDQLEHADPHALPVNATAARME